MKRRRTRLFHLVVSIDIYYTNNNKKSFELIFTHDWYLPSSHRKFMVSIKTEELWGILLCGRRIRQIYSNVWAFEHLSIYNLVLVRLLVVENYNKTVENWRFADRATHTHTQNKNNSGSNAKRIDIRIIESNKWLLGREGTKKESRFIEQLSNNQFCHTPPNCSAFLKF